MRPQITTEEIELLREDLKMLADQPLAGVNVYEALRLLEMRRQTAKLEFIKQALTRMK